MNVKNNIYTRPARLLLIFLMSVPYFGELDAIDFSVSDSLNRIDLTLRGSYQQGWVLPTNDFVKGDNLQHYPINYFRSTTFEATRQTTGEKLWEQLYNYPSYGLGLYYASFINCKEIGQPFGLYIVLDIPIVRRNRLIFTTNMGFGCAFNWESFGEDRYNIALGAEESFIIDLGLSLEYRLLNGLSLDFGTSFTHFSNGDLQNPNYGINLIGPKMSLIYNFKNSIESFKYQPIPRYEKQSECLVSVFTGWKNELYHGDDVELATANNGVYYNVYGLSATFNRQTSYRSKIGLGLMADYLGSANSSILPVDGKLVSKNASFRDGFELSIFPSYELVIDKFSFQFQPGFYLCRTRYPFMKPVAYQRVGIKYNFFKGLSFGLYLRAYYFNISDYLEWTMAYRFHL